MDFVNQFHDTLFDDACNKSKLVNSEDIKYTPQQCPAEWFIEDENDATANVSKLKFRADKLYAIGNYEEAIENYAKVIPLLEGTNFTIKRDCLEGMTRAAIKLEDYTRAGSWIEEMMQVARSSTQFCSVWKLQAQIYHLIKNYTEEINTLKLLLKHYPMCPEYWLQLGKCYLYVKLNDQENKISPDKANFYIAACLIRCRTLLDTVENNPRYLNLQRSQDIKREVDATLESLQLSETFLSAANNNLNRDIKKTEEENLKFEDLPKLDHKNKTNDIPSTDDHFAFDKSWFSWLNDCKQ